MPPPARSPEERDMRTNALSKALAVSPFPARLHPRLRRRLRRVGAGFSRMETTGAQGPAGAAARAFTPYIRSVHPDGKVTILSAHMDMGQGIYYGLATLCERGAARDWSQIDRERGRAIPRSSATWIGVGRSRAPADRPALSPRSDRYRRRARRARPDARAGGRPTTWKVPVAEIVVERGRCAPPGAPGKLRLAGVEGRGAAVPTNVRLRERRLGLHR